MKSKTTIYEYLRRFCLLIILQAAFCFSGFAQFPPVDTLPGDPGVITAYTVQGLSFGGFSANHSGGKVTISPQGTRSVTGGVVGVNQGQVYQPAIFDIDAVYGSVISVSTGPDFTLTGSNGGSMTVHVSGTDPPSPFITTVHQPQRTQVRVGAILSVGNAASNPPGNYSGTMYITFNLE